MDTSLTHATVIAADALISNVMGVLAGLNYIVGGMLNGLLPPFPP